MMFLDEPRTHPRPFIKWGESESILFMDTDMMAARYMYRYHVKYFDNARSPGVAFFLAELIAFVYA